MAYPIIVKGSSVRGTGIVWPVLECIWKGGEK